MSNELPSLLMRAAHSAAVADGLIPSSGKSKSGTPRSGTPLNDGKHNTTEEAAAAGLAGMVKNSSKQQSTNSNSIQYSTLNDAAAVVAGAPSMSLPVMRKQTLSRPQASMPAPSAPTTQSQSLSSSSSKPSSSSSKQKGPPLRRGKWTAEEEAYANRLIQEFKSGLLPLTDGTTLRTFLSKLLNCDPMRISKKFVGSNCIGKQVFRRRTADINRLPPEQIETSRQELSELERRFLERVAQTNRVKSNGSVSTSPVPPAPKPKVDDDLAQSGTTSTPAWLRPPNGFKPGSKSSSLSNTNNRAAAAGRALLQGIGGGSSTQKSSGLERKSSKPSLSQSRSYGSASLLMAELQRKRSQQSLLQSLVANSLQNGNNSSSNLLNTSFESGNSGGLSNTAIAQIARNASAARIAGLAASGHSMNSLMLKTGLSRDQLTQLARDQQLNSSQSLSNMIERQCSFDALMSLDFQSLQSIDNLANLIQSGAGGSTNALGSQIPKSGLKNWEAGSNGNLASLVNARRRQSEGRMESLLRTLSSGNVAKNSQNGLSSSGSSSNLSNANFGNVLQSIQKMGSANSLLSNPNLSSTMLANMLRSNSSTGLTALRMQDGLVQRNSSVDDFLSLVASGDIPHQDPHLLNVPLQSVMQQQQAAQSNSQNNGSSAQAVATYLAQQQLLAKAGLGNNSAASLMSQLSTALKRSTSNTNAAATALAQQQHQARALQVSLARAQQNSSAAALNELKRKVMDDAGETQGAAKRTC